MQLRSGWILALAGLITVLSLIPPAAGYVRQDADDGNYLVGRLGWDGEAGTIAWDDRGSIDPGGPGAGPAKDEYVSLPLARTVRLNASRNLEVDLFTVGVPSQGSTSCLTDPQLGAELRIEGGPLLGGIAGGRSFINTNQASGHSASLPSDPEGYGVCRLRFGAEIGVLEEGSILRLTITHRAADAKHPQYGMGPGHASVLRIPQFSDDEVPYRYPSYAHGAPSSGSGQGLGAIWGGLGLGGLAVAARRGRDGRRRVAVLVGLPLLASLLAGCASHAPTSGAHDPRQPATASLAPAYQSGSPSQKGLGSLAGQVQAADSGGPIAGAYAALLGTALSAQTDPYGRFVFHDVPAGTYSLHVDRDGYESYDARVPILADLIARVNVSLIPKGGDPGLRPHVHDYWGEATQKGLLDHVDLGSYGCAYQTGLRCVTITVFRVPPPPPEGEFASILPGTYEVNVSLEWDPASMGFATVGLMVQANNDPARDNWTFFLPRGPGEPFRIATAWEMADPGHQRFSTWTFQVYPGAAAPSQGAAQDQLTDVTNTLSAPSYKASLSIQKGVVPLEPAHRDPWRGGDRLVVIDNQLRYAGARVPGRQEQPYEAAYWWTIPLFPAHPVPVGTTWVEVYGNWTRDVLYGTEVRLKTAASGPPTASCWAGSGWCDSPDPGYQVVGSTNQRLNRWVVPVTGDDADPFYSPRSFWVVGFQPRQTPQDAALMLASVAEPKTVAGVQVAGLVGVAVTVVAHRGPMPA